MATLTSQQLKDSYQGLLTIKTADDANPLSGRLENGLGNAITALGIGTDSPAKTLHILNSDTNKTAQLKISDGSSDTSAYIGSFANTMWLTNGGTYSGSWSLDGDYGIGVIEIGSVDGGSLIRLNTASSNTTSTERMKVHSSGDISFRDGATNEAFYWDASAGSLGIGNTSPASFLPNGRELVLGNGSASHGMTIFSDSAGTGNLFFADGTTGDQAYRGFLRYAHSSDNMEFYTAGANLRMTIDSSGNVSIKASGADQARTLSLQGTNGASEIYQFNLVADGENAAAKFMVGVGGGAATERMRILPGGGLTFNGDTATANALDDYEEGTHDPTLSDDTYTANIGTAKLGYTKVGNMVTITGFFYVNSYDASASKSRVSLPFAIADLSNQAGDFAGTVRARKLNTSNTHHVIAYGAEGNSYISLQEIVDNADPVNIGGSAYQSGTTITLNFSYFTS